MEMFNGIKSVQCLDLTLGEVKPAVHVQERNYNSLSYRLDGEVEFVFDGEKAVSGKDMLTFVPADCAYDTRVLGQGRMLVAHFETASPVLDKPCILKPEEPPLYRNLFFTLLGTRDPYMAVANLYVIFSKLRGEIKARHEPRLSTAIAYMEEHLADSALGIGRLADYAGVSEVYFRKLFLQYYGIQPVKYLRKRRIELAKALLSTGYYSVLEVAERSGFTGNSYFTAEFKKETGLTPSAYMCKE